jgi:hypothetical protein
MKHLEAGYLFVILITSSTEERKDILQWFKKQDARLRLESLQLVLMSLL